MTANRISAHFYIKQTTRSILLEKRDGGRAQELKIDEKAQEVISRFSKIGDSIGLPVGCQRFPWPKFRQKAPDSEIVDSTSDGESPESEKFNADVNVCILPGLQDTDSVVGHLIARKNRANLLTCIITIADLPDFADKKAADFFRTLLTIPTESSPIPGTTILQPYADNDSRKVWDKTKNPLIKGRMTIHQFDDISDMFIKQLIMSMRIQKYGLQ